MRNGCIPIQEEPPRRLYRVSEWEGEIGGYGIEYTERGRWWSIGAISFRTREGAHAAIQQLIARK
jgi:hypothetical protein